MPSPREQGRAPLSQLKARKIVDTTASRAHPAAHAAPQNAQPQPQNGFLRSSLVNYLSAFFWTTDVRVN
jgi:hypothetical protein